MRRWWRGPAETRESRMPRQVAAPLANGSVSRKSRPPSWASWGGRVCYGGPTTPMKTCINSTAHEYASTGVLCMVAHSVKVVDVGGEGEVEEEGDLAALRDAVAGGEPATEGEYVEFQSRGRGPGTSWSGC